MGSLTARSVSRRPYTSRSFTLGTSQYTHQSRLFHKPGSADTPPPPASFQFVVSLYEEQPLLVDMSEPVAHKYVLATAPRRVKVEEDAEKRARQKKDDARHMTTVTIYTKSGDHILAGTNKGNLNIIDARTHEIIYTQLKVCSGVVTTLKLTRSGRELLVNGQDKVIKTFHLPDLSAEDLDSDTIQLPIEHKFEDVVNRCSWNHVTFSCTGEYVVASTYNNHELYIWERGHGSLVRMLEGPKEEQGVIEWHPSKALLAACGLETGRINIWSVTSPQRWSALAPDFVEVEENVEYMEREDEFDIHPQEEIKKRKLDQEDEEVDVMTIGLAGVGDHPGGFEIPILFNLGDSDSEEEFVAVSTGTMRRRSPGDGADASGEVTGTEEKPGKKAGNRGRARRR